MGALAWSITTYTDAQLSLILGYSQFFAYYSPPSTQFPGYYLQCGFSPATPYYAAYFFKTNSLLGADALDTVSRLFDWCRRLFHYFTEAGYPFPNPPFFWGPTSPPIGISLIIEGTTYSGNLNFNPPLFKHFTAGCGGTTEFMKSVLRAVNIPTEARSALCPHQMPFFPTIDRSMSHGDDPYNELSLVSPFPGWPVPTKQEYLITGAQWNQWFGPGVDYNTSQSNIGRHIADLAVQYQSDGLLKAYCQDLTAQASHGNGEVFKALGGYFTLAQLEAKQLWQKLEAKASATNFCSQFP
jgi:hypothetical protein